MRNEQNNKKGSHKSGEDELDPEDFKEVKKRGTLGNIYLKGMGSIGLVENTTLDKGFVESIAQHEEYRCNIDKMFNAVELILQPNPTILAEGKLNEDAMTKLDGTRPFMHPFQRVGKHLVDLQQFLQPTPGQPDYLGKTERFILQTLPGKLDEMAELEKKSRTNCRSLMNRTRLFLTKDFDSFKENRREIERNLLVMDDMRNQVKKAKTKAELEKAGKGYTAAVFEFNRRAELIDRVLESHAENVYFHQRDLSRMFGERANFHQEMAGKIQEWNNMITAADET